MTSSRLQRFNGVLAWVLLVGIPLVGLTIAAVNLLDREAIEEAAAQNLHSEFLRAAGSVSRIVSTATGDIQNVGALREAFQDIFDLRPGIRRLDVFEVSGDSGSLILSSHPQDAPSTLSFQEWAEVRAGRSVTQFDGSGADRAWIIAAPILKDGRVIGALRGRFSLWKYDRLILLESKLARDIGLAAVSVTCLGFLLLIRWKIQRPVRRLLQAMRRAEAGDLSSAAPLVGPSDIQELAGQYNRMLERVRIALVEKERLLGEIQRFNETLMTKVSEATEELRVTNQKLVETRVQAERVERLAALGELSAVVAHELGNPLNAISGHVQMLAKVSDAGSRDRERHLTIIRTEVERMIATIQHLLDSTRVRVYPAPVELNEVIRDVLALLAPGLRSRQIVLKASLTPSIPPIAGDHHALRGMLFNLATNAVQAMPDGGELEVVTKEVLGDKPDGLTVLAATADLTAGAVRVVVRDTGLGIPAEQLGRIFEPFFTTRHHEGGTGLGLAICRRVVAAVGGRLAVQSTVGQGTAFTVDLPAWSAPAAGGRDHAR